MLGGDY
jgi:hypothetical protein